MVDKITISGGWLTAILDLSAFKPTTQGWLKKIEDAKRKALSAARRVGLAVFRRETPHKYGKKLYASWRADIRPGAKGSLTLSFENPMLNRKKRYKLSGADLLRLLTEGSPAHIIEPRESGGILKVPAERTSFGASFFAKSVRHTGTKPNYFVKRAMDAAYQEAGRVLAAELKKL